MSSNFAPTPAELALVNQIFTQADTQKIGILTGDVAVKVFQGAKLAPTVLGEIWSIADDDNNGFLTKKGVSIAVRLMGHAQKGQKVDKSLVNKPGPLANIEGVQMPLIPQGTGASTSKSPPPSLPPLTPQDRAKFTRIFQGCGPVNGLLNGDKARDVFFKSKLPLDKLSQIWTLCDTQDRGVLDITDFTIAMYLIQACMAGQLLSIPSSIPSSLFEQAGAVSVHATGGSAHFSSPGFPPVPRHNAVQPQLTGQASPAPPLPNRRLASNRLAPTIPPFPGVAQWDVTAAEKASADRFFDTLDSQHRGYIEGDVAVPFMLQSKLPEDVLAQVWDLADINNDGRLTRDGFAVAMHLIQGSLSGKDVPSTLPPTLVPPSMRGGQVPFVSALAPSNPEPVRDLLWDDSPPPSATTSHPPTSILQPQTTGTPHSPRSFPRLTPLSQDPFGSSPATSPSNRNFLDDDDTHAPPILHDQSVEIGNVQNQFNSTQRSLQTAKAEREALESTLANQAAQLSALQTQLAAAKASYETETSLLNTLRDRHASQNTDIQRTREELIRDESDLSAVRVEKAEIEGSFLRDKEEVRELNRRMAEVTAQIAVVKQDVEKAKKDAKHQKGLLAIAKKQLVAKESEKIRVDKELEEAQQDLTDTITEREKAEAEAEKIVITPLQAGLERSKSPDSVAFAAAHPLPVTPDITGAAMSPISVKSNNPFERLALSSGASTPRSQSPFLSFPNASYPAPPGLSSPPGLYSPATIQSDVFSQASDTEPVLQTDNAPDTDSSEFVVVTPRVKDGPYFSDGVVSSPTSDEHFTTPPTSITPVNPNPSANDSSLDSAAAHFPAIDDFNTQHLAPEEGEKETDLSTDLQELEVNDTESESEDSHESEAVDHLTDSAKEVSPSEPVSSQAPTSFDDIFGVDTDIPERVPASSSESQSDTAAPSQNGTSLVDAFGAPFSELETTPSQLFRPSETSGLNSFDEALGKISNGGSTQPASAFSFDSNFEDNFDFGTAMASSSSTFPPPPSGSTPTNGISATSSNMAMHANEVPDLFTQPASNGISATPNVSMTQPAAPVSFDEVFSSGPWDASSTAPQPEKAGSKQADAGVISFQDAFGGVDSSQALALDSLFPSKTSKAFASSASPPSSEGSKPFPNISPPVSPRGPSSPRVTSIRSTSPPRRATSPPPRAVSPKLQRPSSSSTKEPAHDKPPPPPRHSKLSIRLPFGKKKKQDSVPPIPPSSLSQNVTVTQEARVTPGVEDDVEPVKQLSAMGFSRTQAVEALEAYDYDVQRALNKLLGAQ
ncbi:uncharacterized protein F5147DRAFT_676647 [Suillus discolor]|uniref:Cytoskeletal adapter protein sagA n=1 Tax=Suillus discolor TaxID=1912936 RepID=A0A9P7FF28_9AGAM|nr:uncharacterized protein F5147DRAFT_676647 [Suillus discolor]KAG2115224.1 hypothetical protein F5147DRAFT_676647 [Suillus discolor]